jgi:hypothetical protein
MKFTINGMTIPLAVPHLQAEAALELITAENGAQINVLNRTGIIAQMIRLEFNEKGELELNVWAHDRNPHLDDPWASNTLLLSDETCEAE